MFGDLLGNMEAQQAKMREELAAIIVEAEAGDGAVRVTANAARVILNIALDREKLDPNDAEQLEDLITVAVNRALTLAAEQEAAAAQEMLKKMMPPGMDGLPNLFG